MTGSIVALGAIGLALVYSIASVPNFAHGELLTLGAYVALLVNQPDTVPVFGRLAASGGLTLAGEALLFVLAVGSAIFVVYLVGGRNALMGGWASDERLGVVGNVAFALGTGVVVVGWAPSVWAAAVLAAVVLAVAAPAVDRIVFGEFREKGAGLATMLIAALGVSFVLRFGTQAFYGAETRRFDVPEKVGMGGYETSLQAAKFFDFYVSGSGVVVDVTDTATDATLAVAGYSWLVVVAGFVGVLAAAYAGHAVAERPGFFGVTPRIVALASAAVAVVAVVVLLASPSSRPTDFVWSTRVRLSVLRLLIVVVALVMMTSLSLLLRSTKLGKAMRASSDNIDLAKVTGIDTDRVMTVTWVIAGVFAGTGGVLLGMRAGTVTVSLGFDLLIPMFAAVILGGVGSVYGAVLGSYIVGLSMDAGVQVLPGIGPEYRVPMAFVVLLLVLFVKPEGLKG